MESDSDSQPHEDEESFPEEWDLRESFMEAADELAGLREKRQAAAEAAEEQEAEDRKYGSAATPTGGRPPYAAAYYFTEKVGGIEITKVREIAVPGDATVECSGNTLVIRHEGVEDTFRIGRVRPLEA